MTKRLTAKELAAMQEARLAAKEDAAKDFVAAQDKGNDTETTETKETLSAPKITRQRANKPAAIVPEAPKTEGKPELTEEEKAAAIAAKKAEREKAAEEKEQSAKEKKHSQRVEYVRIAATLVVKAGLLSKDAIVYRNDKKEVKPGDIACYHNKNGFSQYWIVDHISKAQTLCLELLRDDDLSQRAGTAGSWTAETWDASSIQNSWSKRGGADKRLQFAFFGKE